MFVQFAKCGNILLCGLAFIFCACAAHAQKVVVTAESVSIDAEDEINLYCLKFAYPQISNLEQDVRGNKWIVFKNGQRVLYEDPGRDYGNSLEVDIKTSMATPYSLEPERVPTPAGHSPGRKRSYALLEALYGKNAAEVKSGLVASRLAGSSVSLSPAAAAAFSEALPELTALAGGDSGLRKYLKPDGGFYWRKIAGEEHLSAHSYGIAFDIGSKYAPYWRWSRQNPHPAQQTYPAAIVSALEKRNFIWGGKWHEYDLMHFEYRPEIICKAKLRNTGRKPGTGNTIKP